MNVVSRPRHYFEELIVIFALATFGVVGSGMSSLLGTLVAGRTSTDSSREKQTVSEYSAVANAAPARRLPDFAATLNNYTISGAVKVGTDGLDGATVELTSSAPEGFTPLIFTTDSSGSYSFTDLPAERDYVVTPSKTNYTFTPAQQSSAGLSADVTLPDFAATLNNYTISGAVKLGTGGLDGVTVQLTSPAPEGFIPLIITTDSSGSYSFTDLPAERDYVVTPSKTNYTFAPAQQSSAGLSADVTLPDFAATLNNYTISGAVKVGTAGLDGVTVQLTSPAPEGFTPLNVTTDSSGSYSFTGLPAERDYVVTPSKTNYTFAPAQQSSPGLSADVTLPGFAATLNNYTISGAVKLGTATPLADVMMTLASPNPAGFAPRNVTTQADGTYSFSVPAGRTYTLTASKAYYSFAPMNQSYVNLSADQPNQNFSATPVNYSISGKVLVANAASNINNVTLTLTGGPGFAPRTLIALNAGTYLFDNLPAEQTYTLTPSKPHYNFSPASRVFPNLTAVQTLRNFVAAVRTYTISGQVNHSGSPLGGVGVRLSNLWGEGFTPRRIITDAAGRYRFDGVPEGRSYAIIPSNQRYLFSPFKKVIANLNASQTADFTATEAKSYYISGHVSAGATPLVGALVKLGGTRTGVATTDAQGNYMFGSLPAKGNYTLKLSKKNYTFTPGTRSYAALTAIKTLQDFDAKLKTVAIRGQLPIGGVTVSLSGAATHTAITDENGAYSIVNLPPGGPYTVTPLRENYTFSPSNRSLTDMTDDAVADFAVASGPSHVLEFDGSLQKVDYGEFWAPGIDLGHFFWEFWAMPGQNGGSRYLISDGYGGAHALLFGVYGPSKGQYTLGGNVFDGTKNLTFGSDEGPMENEWGHYAVGWDGTTIVVYFNGVPVGKTPWTGPRRTLGHTQGGGRASVGGSTHQNFIGRMAELRAYEGLNPLEDPNDASLPFSTFTPQIIFDNGGFLGQSATLMSQFTLPVRPVSDLSGANHTGLLKGSPPPQFVIDPRAPTASNSSSAVTAPEPVPGPIPTNALVFDSFSRRSLTYAFDRNGGLGSTEGGTRGPLVWQPSEQVDEKAPFGILNGRAVILARNANAAWIETGNATANLDIRVDRHPGKWGSGVSTGLVFRVEDEENFFSAYTTGAGAAAQRLYVSYNADGSITTLAADVAMPAHWTTLRVVTLSTGDIRVYADSILIYSYTSMVLANATGAGLWNWGSGQGLANRWDNFTVLQALP